jgi:hypothetical protein
MSGGSAAHAGLSSFGAPHVIMSLDVLGTDLASRQHLEQLGANTCKRDRVVRDS